MASMLPLKLLFLFFMALGLFHSLPFLANFSSSHLSLLKPPYLFLILNAIIIIIAASSRFHHPQPSPPSNIKPPSHIAFHMNPPPGIQSVFAPSTTCEPKPEVTVSGVKTVSVEAEKPIDEIVPEFPSEYRLSPEKPLVSARFGHRKPTRAGPEGDGTGRASLRVAKAKRHETLENTWKAITEGRGMPLSRHMKKCETWENHGRDLDVGPAEPTDMMKKSETFKDRANHHQPANGKLRKEPSLSQDELNRRVEAFINKVNEDMRLQRQQSLQQYMEMIKRGNH